MSSIPAAGAAPLPAPFDLVPAAAERLTGGRWHGPADGCTTHGASLDSRRVAPGSIFCCLPGARVDGHDFAAQAAAAGAGLILAQRPLPVPAPVLVVPDVAAALLALAAEFRLRQRGQAWIAVGGANGKTTTKELTASACRAAFGATAVHATAGNLNNHLGVPVSILAMPAGARACVIEVGSNHPGEIAPLAAALRPGVAVVTSIGAEHLEGFGDLLGVAREECSLFAALPADGTALLGLHGLDAQLAAFGGRREDILAAARAAAGDHRLELVEGGAGEADPAGALLLTAHGTARLAVLGAHNLANAELAWRAAAAAGADPAAAVRGLAAARPPGGRLVRRGAGPHTVLDDTYNANPASMCAGLAVLAAAPGARLAVLGGMGELGAASAEGHRLVGAEAARLGLPLITVGAAAAGIAAGYRAAGGTDCSEAADHAAAVAAVRARLAAPATVLVKASRSQGLEAVVAGILAVFAPSPLPPPASPGAAA